MATEPILHPSAEIESCGAAALAAPGPRPGGIREAKLAWPRARTMRFFDLLAEVTVKKILFLAGDVAAVMVAHHMAEILLRHSMKIPATFLNPPDYYLFYVPFFTLLLYLLGGYKNPDLRRPEKSWNFSSRAFRFPSSRWHARTLFSSNPRGFRDTSSRHGMRSLSSACSPPGSLSAPRTPKFWRRGLARQKAILLGSPAGFADFQDRLAIQRHNGCEIAGILLEPGDKHFLRGRRFDFAHSRGARRLGSDCRRGASAAHRGPSGRNRRGSFRRPCWKLFIAARKKELKSRSIRSFWNDGIALRARRILRLFPVLCLAAMVACGSASCKIRSRHPDRPGGQRGDHRAHAVVGLFIRWKMAARFFTAANMWAKTGACTTS